MGGFEVMKVVKNAHIFVFISEENSRYWYNNDFGGILEGVWPMNNQKKI